MDSFNVLNPEVACGLLAAAGFHYTPSGLQVEAHEERWLIGLPA